MTEPVKYRWRKVSDDLHALRVTTSYGNSATFYARKHLGDRRGGWVIGRHAEGIFENPKDHQPSPQWSIASADGAWGAGVRGKLERAAAQVMDEYAFAFTDAFEEREGAAVVLSCMGAAASPPAWLATLHRYGLRVRQLLPDAVLCELM